MIEKCHITIPPRRINVFYPSLGVSFVVLFSCIVGVSTVDTMCCLPVCVKVSFKIAPVCANMFVKATTLYVNVIVKNVPV